MKRLRRRSRFEMGPLFRVDFENDHRPRLQDNRQAPVRVISFCREESDRRERYAQPDLIPAYPCHHVAKQTWRGLWVLLTPMSREDYSTHCDMASRANKGVVLKPTDSQRVLRDHVR
jgi:hypothetical protein